VSTQCERILTVYLQHDEHHPTLFRRLCESGAVTLDSRLSYLGLLTLPSVF